MHKEIYRATFLALCLNLRKCFMRTASAIMFFAFAYTVSAQSGIISTVVGNGTLGYKGDGGSAVSAELNTPSEIAIDSTGNLYIADIYNNRIRKVTPQGVISTVAGTGMVGYNGDGGLATSAYLWQPTGVAVDHNGNLYIADSANYRVRMVNPAGVISTIAGNGTNSYGGDGGLATSAGVLPFLLAVDNSGNLYITDNTYRVRKVDTAGIITTVAGNGIKGSNGDGGLATDAELNGIGGVAVDNSGNMYIAEAGVLTGNLVVNGRIRQVTPTGIISTVAGVGIGGVTLFGPRDIALDSSGNLYIADAANDRILKMPLGGIATIMCGTTGVSGFSGDGGSAIAAKLFLPVSLAFDGTGNLYISDRANDRIRRIAK